MHVTVLESTILTYLALAIKNSFQQSSCAHCALHSKSHDENDEEEVDRGEHGNAKADGETEADDTLPTSHSLHILTHLSVLTPSSSHHLFDFAPQINFRLFMRKTIIIKHCLQEFAV